MIQEGWQLLEDLIGIKKAALIGQPYTIYLDWSSLRVTFISLLSGLYFIHKRDRNSCQAGDFLYGKVGTRQQILHEKAVPFPLSFFPGLVQFLAERIRLQPAGGTNRTYCCRFSMPIHAPPFVDGFWKDSCNGFATLQRLAQQRTDHDGCHIEPGIPI